MFRVSRFLLPVLGLFALSQLVACGENKTTNPDDPNQPAPTAEGHVSLQSSLTRDMNPDVSDEDFAALIVVNHSFALELYQNPEKQNENTLISLLSIRTGKAIAGCFGQSLECILFCTTPSILLGECARVNNCRIIDDLGALRETLG